MTIITRWKHPWDVLAPSRSLTLYCLISVFFCLLVFLPLILVHSLRVNLSATCLKPHVLVFSDYSRPLHNHSTAVEAKGSGCPGASVDCLLLQGWCVPVSLQFYAWKTEERLFWSISLSSVPRTRRRRAESHLHLPEWFFQSAGWRSNNFPKSAESLTQKVLEPTKREGGFEMILHSMRWTKKCLIFNISHHWSSLKGYCSNCFLLHQWSFGVKCEAVVELRCCHTVTTEVMYGCSSVFNAALPNRLTSMLPIFSSRQVASVVRRVLCTSWHQI